MWLSWNDRLSAALTHPRVSLRDDFSCQNSAPLVSAHHPVFTQFDLLRLAPLLARALDEQKKVFLSDEYDRPSSSTRDQVHFEQRQ